jgi:hypothetical protein
VAGERIAEALRDLSHKKANIYVWQLSPYLAAFRGRNSPAAKLTTAAIIPNYNNTGVVFRYVGRVSYKSEENNIHFKCCVVNSYSAGIVTHTIVELAPGFHPKIVGYNASQ